MSVPRENGVASGDWRALSLGSGFGSMGLNTVLALISSRLKRAGILVKELSQSSTFSSSENRSTADIYAHYQPQLAA